LKRRGKIRLRGPVISLQGGSMRFMPTEHFNQPIEVRGKLRMIARIAGSIQVGDEIEVLGRWENGLLIPISVFNLRTGVRVLRRPTAVLNAVILLVFCVLAFVTTAGTNDPAAGAVVLGIGLGVLVIRNIVVGYREKPGGA
jgi:hypothetical protein